MRWPPSTLAMDQVWESTARSLSRGRPNDLPAIQLYERESPQISDRVRQQALLTEKAIHARATWQP